MRHLSHRHAILAVIFLAAAALRFYPLVFPAVWFDEIHTFIVSTYPAPRLVATAAFDAHPPLYFLAVRGLELLIDNFFPSARSINSLRLASILPGLMLCFLGWRLGRRASNHELGLWTAALFALSPSLAFYAVELRNYGPTQFTLFLATIFLIRFFDGPPRARPLNALGYALMALISLYMQNLSILYLLTHGLIFLDEIRRSSSRRDLFLWGATTAIIVGLLYAPWLPRLLHQNEFQKTATFYTLKNTDLPVTFLFYLPFGGFLLEVAPWKPAGKVLMAVSALLFLILAAFWKRTAAQANHHAACSDAGLPGVGDRVLRYCLILTLVPVCLAYLLALFDVAKVFFPLRYNQIAAPYFLVVLVRVSGAMPAAIRRITLACFLAICIPLCVWSQANRLTDAQRGGFLQGRPMEEFFRKPGRLFWTDPRMSPWLDRIADNCFASPREITNSDQPVSESIWFVTHSFNHSDGRYYIRDGAVLEKILDENEAIQRVRMRKNLGWEQVWEVPAEQVPVIRARWREIHAIWQATRDSIPGGQVILPGDPAFDDEPDWSPPSILEDYRLWCWSFGDTQSLDWTGPEQPGRYRIEIQLWRNNPYPAEQLSMGYRWPGESEFREFLSPLGGSTLSGEITVDRPHQPLELRLRIPSWIPRDHLEGSKDDRSLGVEFLSLSLTPLSATR